jgi:hypothetical protein
MQKGEKVRGLKEYAFGVRDTSIRADISLVVKNLLTSNTFKLWHDAACPLRP